YFMIWYVVAQIKKNNGLIDIAWGMSFVVTAVSSLILSGSVNLTKMIMIGVIVLWGMRLSIYLFMRNWTKPEDFRYKAMREKWQTNLQLKAFLKVFLTQSIFSYIISLPVIFTNLYSTNMTEIVEYVLIGVGVAIYLIGFIFEALAD